MSYKIKSELSENQIESDISSYLGYITPIWSKRYRLISVDEQITGADKLFNRFLPIYLQFKVSHGLNPKGTILYRFIDAPLAKIILYRKDNNLQTDPILYFELRKKANNALDFQHNILHSLHKPPNQFALYVAPLTFSISEYENILHNNWFLRYFLKPYLWREIELHDTFTQKQIMIGNNPFLRHHISIPAHTKVTTHRHHYSFSKSGGDVAWHGGDLLNEDFRLSTQFTKIFNSFYFNREIGTNLEQYIEFIKGFELDYNRKSYMESFQSNDPFSIIQDFSRVLSNEYKIKLMLLAEI